MKKLLLVKTKIITISFLCVIASICFLSFNTSSAKKVYAEEIALPTASDTIIEVEEGFELCDEVNIRLSGNAMKFSAKVTKEFHEKISDGADEVTYFATMNVVGSSNVKAHEYGVQPDFTEVNEYNLRSYLNFEGASQNILDIALKTEFQSGAFVKVVKGGQTTFYKAKNSNEVLGEMRVVAYNAYVNYQEGAGCEKQDILDLEYFSIGETTTLDGEQGTNKVYVDTENNGGKLYYLQDGVIEKAEIDERTNWHYFDVKEEKEDYTLAKFDDDNVVTEIEIEIKKATEGLSFSLINGNDEYSITGYFGSDESVYIPAYYNDKPVTTVGEYAFAWCETLTGVEIANGVTSIEEYAFAWCELLTAVDIASGVTNVSYSAFCDSQIEKAIIPANLCLFIANSYLKEVVITSGESIEAFAFFICEFLASIEISNSITSIGEYAFSDCYSLTSITIPSSVVSIGYEAFGGCRNLEVIYCEAESQPAGWDSDWLGSCPAQVFWEGEWQGGADIPTPDYTKGLAFTLIKDDTEYSVTGYTGMTADVIIPACYNDKPVTRIGRSAFQLCSILASVEIPNSITVIDEHAFKQCSNLKTVIFKENSQLKSIGNYAFAYNYVLDSMFIPKSVETISKGAFVQSYLTTITFEDNSNLKTIGDSAFFTCDLLQDIEIPQGVEIIGSDAFNGCMGLTNLIIPNSVISIGSDAFSYCPFLETITFEEGINIERIMPNTFQCCVSLEEIKIPTSVEYIDELAFKGCTNLRKVEFGINSQLITIGTHAFAECKTLYSIELPNGMTSLGDGVFVKCESLLSVEIPQSVTSIGKYAFNNCVLLESVELGEDVINIGESAFAGCSSLTEIELGKNVASIGQNAFLGCCFETLIVKDGNEKYHIKDNCLIETATSRLIIGGKDSKIPSYIRSIDAYAFYNCTSLTSVVIPDSVTIIAGYTFYNCLALTSVEIGANVSKISEYAFYNCVLLKDVSIPTSVTEIGKYAFYNCDSLVRLETGDGVEKIGDNAFYGCESLFSVTIGKKVAKIGYNAFNSCPSLATVVIGESVKEISYFAFENCYSLVEVYDLSSLNITKGSEMNGGIGYRAFDIYKSKDVESKITNDNGFIAYSNGHEKILLYYCGKEANVIIPEGITRIKLYAFRNNSPMTSVKIPETVTSIDSTAFINCAGLTSIEIPDSVKTLGQGAFSYCNSLKIVVIGKGVEKIDYSLFTGSSQVETIYCKAESQPSGWNDNWNIDCRATVLWAGEWEYVGGVPTKK